MTHLIMLGAGGHARVLVEALNASGRALAGFVTPRPEFPTGGMAALARLGDEDQLLAGGPEGVVLVNGIGSVGDTTRRQATFTKFRNEGFAFASVVHPSAMVASDVAVGEGAQIMACAILQAGARTGANVIINTGAIVEHDCDIGDHVHVSPGACLAGGVTVGAASHIGAGATVIQNVRIEERALIAAGAVVVRNVAAGTTVAGVPARELRRS